MRQIRVLIAAWAAAAILSAAPSVRITHAIDTTETFVLEGHTRPLLSSAQDLGPADPTVTLPQLALRFRMTAAQSADLNTLLQSQRNRGSHWYHRWLTPEQFGARFGVHESDLNKVRQWLETAGFTNVQIAPGRNSVQMSASTGAVNSLFGVAIHRFQKNGKEFYANTANPVLPRALQGLVSSLKGLSTYQARPFLRRWATPQISVGINGNHFLGPNDLATIYDLNSLYGQGTNGAGQSIAVVGQSDIRLSDIEAFQTAVGLPIKDPQIIQAGTDPGINPDEAEADLDLEWSGAVARGANVIYVNSSNALDSAVYAIDYNIAPIVSISYGLCEAAISTADLQAFNQVFQQANAQGITVVVASGDTGAAACDVDQDPTGTPETAASFGLAVSFPASSPYVTAVGGTEFDESQGNFWDSTGHATSYIPEIAWNDTPSFKALDASGGGASSQFAKPDWQAGAGVPADGARDVPDIALSASPVHDPYLICSAGSCSDGFAPPVSRIYFVGGTSCAAPVFSGILALLNQSSNGRQGNVNAGLYALASFNSGVFHDIEVGDNRVPCTSGSPNCTQGMLGFTTAPTYDQVTGLGSVDAGQLVQQWGSDFQIALSPAFLNFSSGKSAAISVQVTRFANFSGDVAFNCSVAGSLGNTTCSVPGTVNGSGVVMLTVVNTASATLLPWVYWFRTWPPVVWLLTIAAASFALWMFRRKPYACAGMAAGCLIMAIGCGQGASTSSFSLGQQSLTGNITIVATSGVLQHVITVPVTIH